jgi:two-component system, response regulator RpfG
MSKSKVVVIDDQATGRSILVKILNNSFVNTEIISFEAAKDALIWLEEYNAELVITDYSMPDVDGLAFTEKLKIFNHHKNTPVIMITAIADNSVRDQADKLGIVDFIRRPINQNDCVNTVSKYLKLS